MNIFYFSCQMEGIKKTKISKGKQEIKGKSYFNPFFR